MGAEVAVPLDVAAVVTVPTLMSVATVSRLLDCSPRTIRRRIAEGSLPAVKDHERVMIRADELRDYIDRLERISQPTARPRRARHAPRFEFLRD